jgi:hypothetical protein
MSTQDHRQTATTFVELSPEQMSCVTGGALINWRWLAAHNNHHTGQFGHPFQPFNGSPTSGDAQHLSLGGPEDGAPAPHVDDTFLQHDFTAAPASPQVHPAIYHPGQHPH